jgi:hypothetical protein
MIVEDEILITTALRDELKDAGYHVLDLTDRYTEVLGPAILRCLTKVSV